MVKRTILYQPMLLSRIRQLTATFCQDGSNPGNTQDAVGVNCAVGVGAACGGGSSVKVAAWCGNGPNDNAVTNTKNCAVGGVHTFTGTSCDNGSVPH